jgi:hypothetical protein
MKYSSSVLIIVVLLLIPAVSYGAGDPILVFSFDNIDGDMVEDESGFGNDGTMENNPAIVDGKYGDALEFSNSRVKVLASDSLGSELFADGTFTLVMWINAKRTGNAWQQIFRAGVDPNDTLFINNDGRLSWRGWVGAAWAGGMCETDPGVVEADTWTHVAVVSDAKNFWVYVNGELSKESAFQQTRGNNTEYVIGGYAGGESYSGAVDELAIFAEKLDENTIKSIMEKGIKNATPVEYKSKLATRWGWLKTD